MTKTYSKTRILVEGALMIALSTVLSMIQIPLMPHGGSITLFSMVPILVMSYRPVSYTHLDVYKRQTVRFWNALVLRWVSRDSIGGKRKPS